MTRRWLAAGGLWMASVMSALGATTIIQDTVRTGGGQLANGWVSVAPGNLTVAISGGALTVVVTSGSSYVARYTFSDGTTRTESWCVTMSGGPVTLAQVACISTVTPTNLANPAGLPDANTPLVADGSNGDQWATDTLQLDDGLLSVYSDASATGHNVFLGYSAGNRTMGPAGGSAGLASYNVGIGYYALNANTTGTQNVAVGELALAANTTGSENVAVGASALAANTTGSWNTAVGQQALEYNTTGYDNYAFGLRALDRNTTGYNNAAFGIDSVGINTTGYRNAGFGVDSCAWNVTGFENACMGMNTLWSLTTGYDNAATGFNAMFGATSGHYLTGLGAYADLYYPNTSSGVTLTATDGTANLGVGWYWYKVSFVLGGVETALSSNSYLGVLTDATHKEVTIAGLPTYSGPFTASARRIYRTVVCPTALCTVITANQAPRRWYYVDTINDNVTTGYVDSVADASLGAEESSTPSKSIALGARATVYKSYQMVAGSDPSPIYEIWLGNGMVTATAPAGVQMASSGASGTDAAGEPFIFAGGPGTGAAAGGSLIFKTAAGGSSGAAWNALTERWRIDAATGRWQSGGTWYDGTGGLIYNSTGGADTVLTIQETAHNASQGTAGLKFTNNAGTLVGFVANGNYTVGDGSNWKFGFLTQTLAMSSDAIFAWKNANNVYAGSYDTGLARETATPGMVKVTNGGSGYGSIDAGGYSASGTAGVTSTTCTQWTNGLCTHN